MTANNDSAELEALFDSVAATVRVEPAPAAPPHRPHRPCFVRHHGSGRQ